MCPNEPSDAVPCHRHLILALNVHKVTHFISLHGSCQTPGRIFELWQKWNPSIYRCKMSFFCQPHPIPAAWVTVFDPYFDQHKAASTLSVCRFDRDINLYFIVIGCASHPQSQFCIDFVAGNSSLWGEGSQGLLHGSLVQRGQYVSSHMDVLGWKIIDVEKWSKSPNKNNEFSTICFANSTKSGKRNPHRLNCLLFNDYPANLLIIFTFYMCHANGCNFWLKYNN